MDDVEGEESADSADQFKGQMLKESAGKKESQEKDNEDQYADEDFGESSLKEEHKDDSIEQFRKKYQINMPDADEPPKKSAAVDESDTFDED